MKHDCIKIGNIFCVFSGTTWVFYTIALHAIMRIVVSAHCVLLKSPDGKNSFQWEWRLNPWPPVSTQVSSPLGCSAPLSFPPHTCVPWNFSVSTEVLLNLFPLEHLIFNQQLLCQKNPCEHHMKCTNNQVNLINTFILMQFMPTISQAKQSKNTPKSLLTLFSNACLSASSYWIWSKYN